MRRLLAILGGLALLRAWLARRPRSRGLEAPPASPEAGPDPRAEELRRRLDESRALVSEREEFEGGETAVDEVEPPEERRRDVHERGRAAIDEMRDRRGEE